MFEKFSFVPSVCVLLHSALSVVVNRENNGVEWEIPKGILLVLRDNRKVIKNSDIKMLIPMTVCAPFPRLSINEDDTDH